VNLIPNLSNFSNRLAALMMSELGYNIGVCIDTFERWMTAIFSNPRIGTPFRAKYSLDSFEFIKPELMGRTIPPGTLRRLARTPLFSQNGRGRGDTLQW
jgi:hypothetical protein